MKLYDAPWAPSPRRVRIFLAEKGVTVPRVAVDLRGGEHRRAPYLAANPRATVPALELDDGEILSESAAICRYFEALYPQPSLFGGDALAIGRIESWTRRIEADGYAAAVYAFRNRSPAFEGRAIVGNWPPVAQIPELAARGELMWDGFVESLDQWLADRRWIADDTYSFADITALVTIDFARAAAKLTVPEAAAHVLRWHSDALARPSAAA